MINVVCFCCCRYLMTNTMSCMIFQVKALAPVATVEVSSAWEKDGFRFNPRQLVDGLTNEDAMVKWNNEQCFHSVSVFRYDSHRV